jgi:excisionase family DNA binding protein
MASIFLEGIEINEFLSLIKQEIEGNSNDTKKEIANRSISQGSNLITRKEASKLLSISLPTLNSYTKLGYLKAFRLGTKQVRYKRSDVELCLQEIGNFKHRTHSN